jgi:rhamnulokinase
MPHERLYEVNGLQFLPFTTLYQLAAERPAALARASTLLLLPDLLGYWLTGVAGAELTNASTTGLLDVRSRTWSTELTGLLDLDAGLLPPLRRPGDVLGTLLPHVAEETGLAASTPVVAVGSHDTASAVVGAPLSSGRAAYVSCGTWALVGLELPAPVLSAASRAANFTNELGVDDQVRYLRNVMGLWLVSESVRTWTAQGLDVDLPTLLAAAERLPAGPVVDADDPRFLPPGDMPARIADACRRTGQEVPAGPPAVVRCIVDSLAAAFARAVADAGRLAGCEIDVVHVVGGGALNALLCRLTATACGLPVVAGPVEATALGNVLVQAAAAGAVAGGLVQTRALVGATQPLTRYDPDPALREP